MGFVDKPQQLWWRKLLFQVHLWTGLVIGAILLLVGLSGSIIVFYTELYEWQEPKVEIRDGAPSLSVEQLFDRANERFPDLNFTGAYLPEHPDQAVQLRATGEDVDRWPYVYLHPQTGTIVGETVTREPFLDWAYRLHMYLLAGDTGYTINAVCALLATGLCLSGVVLWWPGVKSWVRALKVKTTAGWKRVNYDLHSVVGFWSAVCLALVFLTGAYFRFPEPFVAAVETVTGSSAEREPLVIEPRDAPYISSARAMAIAERAIPNARTTRIGFPSTPEGPIYVSRKREADGLDYAGNYVYLDPYTGEVLRKVLYEDRSIAQIVLRWFGYIHFGTFGGVATQILWVFLGLTPGALFVTGFLMYWNRVLSKRWAKLRSPRTEPSWLRRPDKPAKPVRVERSAP